MKQVKGLLGIVLLLVGTATLNRVAQADDAVVIPRVRTPPRIDGSLQDAAWAGALRISGFQQTRGRGPADPDTVVRVAFDPKALYVAFDCPEPSAAGIKRRFKYRDDEFLDDDDCVEAFLDPTGSGETYYHFAVNPNGAVWDALHLSDTTVDNQWSSKRVEAAARIGADRWRVEMRIPFADLDGPPVAHGRWRYNFARERRAGARDQFSSTSGEFCRGAAFGTARFALPERTPGLTVTALGALTAVGNRLGANVFALRLDPAVGAPSTYTVTADRLAGDARKRLFRKTVTRGDAPATVRAPYRVNGVAGERIAFTVTAGNGKVAFRKTIAVRTTAGQHMPPPNPLYEELLTDEDPGLAREGLLLWPDRAFPRVCKAFCVRYGLTLDPAEAFQDYADHGLIAVNSMVILKHYRFPEFSRRMGIRACVWPTSPKGNRANPERCLLFEEDLEAFRQGCLRIAGTPHAWAVFWGDELRENTVKQSVRIYAGVGKRARRKYVRETLNADVMKRFGYGRYGIPQGPRDTDPFRWIAWCRYVNAREREIFLKVRREATAVSPYLRFVSEDCNGALHPYEFSTSADVGDCDIYNHQTNPRTAGLISKLLADLTRKEVWPVVHIEHYNRSLRPDQVREVLSDVFRNGGTGFVLYPTDSTRGKTYVKSMSFSAPERWSAAMEIVDRVRRQPKLRFPKPDFGVFFSDTALQAVSPFVRWGGSETAAAHALLGPKGCRAWWRFVDENIILKHKGALDAFKALMIPSAKYQLPETPAALRAYAESGGTLVCFDPEGFSFASDGSSLAGFRKDCFGVTVGEALETATSIAIRDEGYFGMPKGGRLPVFGEAYALTAAPDCRVLAAFGDGRPAVVSRRVGRGRAIFFAFNPLNGTSVRSREWRKAFRGIAAGLRLATDRDIWRFTFPPFERDLYPEDPSGVCLTNNYLRFENDLPLYLNNLDSGGSYRAIPEPDGAADQGGAGETPFAKGDLTDRRKAYAFNNKKTSPDDWRIGWKSARPVTVFFDLKRPFPLTRVRIFYSGQLPAFEVRTSADGRSWTPVAERRATQETEGVRMVARSFQPRRARYLRVRFGQRSPGKRFDLVEMEVWAAANPTAPRGLTARAGAVRAWQTRSRR